MEAISQAELQSIKDYKFAILPPRIYKKDVEKEKTSENGAGKYDVQCQICGRMGLMSIAEMEKHHEKHRRSFPDQVQENNA